MAPLDPVVVILVLTLVAGAAVLFVRRDRRRFAQERADLLARMTREQQDRLDRYDQQYGQELAHARNTITAQQQALEVASSELRKAEQQYAWVARERAERTRELDETRKMLAERDAEVADLKRKIGEEWAGTLTVRIVKHRGKGGTVPETKQAIPINGKKTSFRQMIHHHTGDVYDVVIGVDLGA